MPLEYLPGENSESLGLTGKESYTIEVPEDLKTGQTVDIKVEKQAFQLFQLAETAGEKTCYVKFGQERIGKDCTGCELKDTHSLWQKGIVARESA